jgi:hypothetical protein
MGLELKGIRGVDDVPFGIYIWRMPDGSIVGDDDGNWMNIPAKKGDQTRINKLRDAARYYGIEEGGPVFMSGNRRVTDEQYEEQKQRAAWGLVPDPEDIGNSIDELRDGTL